MIEHIRKLRWVKKIQKYPLYYRIRSRLPMTQLGITDDSSRIDDAKHIPIDWPVELPKPMIGIVQDTGGDPRWTKYCRLLNYNDFPYGIFSIHSHDWIEKAEKFDIIAGVRSSEMYDLSEIREKFYFLEKYMGKSVFPAFEHSLLYENKLLEGYLAEKFDFPMAPTFISHDLKDALDHIDALHYPLVSKMNPTSGSIGVELVRTPAHARNICLRAFSMNGRKTQLLYRRQKNYVYFQEFIPNDGYDIRVIIIGSFALGYYRKTLKGDFRASGMNQVEKRALPEKAILNARELYKVIKSPMLVVDMVHALDDTYPIIEYSPLCQIETANQLEIDGVPGAYVFQPDGSYRFEPGKYWMHELALGQFIEESYLPRARKKFQTGEK
ncbi:MAG: hypothetical protein JW750_02365 [Anaerolineaceae bacterium]|nr:hypothetical protein [Anaerolineaceae bacterium]